MLYNVTFRLDDYNTFLIPYVPFSAPDDEDVSTPRICFSDRIEHCIESLSVVNRNLYRGCGIVIRSVDENTLDKTKLVTPQILFNTKKVPDALETNEHWYLDTVNVKRKVYIVDDFDFGYDIAFTCIPRMDMNNIIKKHFPNDSLGDFESIKDAYTRIMNKEKDEDKKEAFSDDLYELPWARKISITNLVLLEL